MSSGYRRALYHGVAASVEHEAMLKQLQCKTVIDVGANRGQFALTARHCFPEAKILSFEPLRAPRRYFHKVFRNDPRVCLFEVAIGPLVGNETMHVSKRDDSSSILPITPMQVALFPGTAEVSLETIAMSTLDKCITSKQIEGPALLKVDVQGFELEALKGCESLLQNVKYAYIECSFLELYLGQSLASDVIGWLASHGFSLSGIYNPTCNQEGRAVQADLLFIKE